MHVLLGRAAAILARAGGRRRGPATKRAAEQGENKNQAAERAEQEAACSTRKNKTRALSKIALDPSVLDRNHLTICLTTGVLARRTAPCERPQARSARHPGQQHCCARKREKPIAARKKQGT
jgi:hypothetical protein